MEFTPEVTPRLKQVGWGRGEAGDNQQIERALSIGLENFQRGEPFSPSPPADYVSDIGGGGMMVGVLRKYIPLHTAVKLQI